MHFRLPRELRPGFRIDKGILNLYTAFPSCTSTIGVTRAFLLLLLSAGYPLWLLLGAFSRTSAVVGLENGDFDPLGKEHFCSARLGSGVVKNLGCWSWWPNHLPRMTQWIQYKLGKQYLLKKVTLPWESNPGPTPIRGDPATLVASVGLKKEKEVVGSIHSWLFICTRQDKLAFQLACSATAF